MWRLTGFDKKTDFSLFLQPRTTACNSVGWTSFSGQRRICLRRTTLLKEQIVSAVFVCALYVHCWYHAIVNHRLVSRSRTPPNSRRKLKSIVGVSSFYPFADSSENITSPGPGTAPCRPQTCMCRVRCSSNTIFIRKPSSDIRLRFSEMTSPTKAQTRFARLSYRRRRSVRQYCSFCS